MQNLISNSQILFYFVLLIPARLPKMRQPFLLFTFHCFDCRISTVVNFACKVCIGSYANIVDFTFSEIFADICYGVFACYFFYGSKICERFIARIDNLVACHNAAYFRPICFNLRLFWCVNSLAKADCNQTPRRKNILLYRIKNILLYNT